ncbi:MAG: DUF502 domain-containing protein [Planctomycetota bacterium]|nr:MAG: DUF502 domain-containing protein [Planctomycetota bacterium]REJ97492.1 MAG: DUF502 domain-containing protein [Planctomycetota bacterium]REK20956.1 MAG: DUF502 domain-containing protein [Planctomycetota bacterium]REK37262.1 MAG: DUF502 domain-containing protein [Planctomycetota bacterium]
MPPETDPAPKPQRPALRFFLRGLAISLPTILTIVIVLWLVTGVNRYIIQPTAAAVKYVFAAVVDESVAADSLVVLRNRPELEYCGRNYSVTPETASAFRSLPPAEQTADALLGRSEDVYVPFVYRAVPYDHYARLARVTPADEMPHTAITFYMDFAAEKYFKSAFLLSAFAVILVIVALYFLGRIVSARLGAWTVAQLERNILGRLPVIRNVYGSVKQVTDFLFTESKVEYRRVVAIEYPRRGIWSLALVTGDGMLDVATALEEPTLSVIVPSSPMPVTGYTMCVPRSAVLDLNISVDQAMQFVISCGVLVPPEQKITPELLRERLAQQANAQSAVSASRETPQP